MTKYDYLIVGSGLYGAMFAWKATQVGKRCLVLDRRPHAGGNLYCENVEGINVHKYGPHIFHTSNKEVWDFVNSIVPFNGYINMPQANFHGEIYNLPFNMHTFHQMWGVQTAAEAQAIIEQQMAGALEKMHSEGAVEPRNLEEQALLLVGRDIYEKLVKEYTQKQWGRRCSELPAFIIRRLPVRFEYNNNYFNDKYQGIPIGGYNRLIDGLLDGIELRCGVDFLSDKAYWSSLAEKVLFTGCLDEYFDYCFGKLEYRSLRFEQQTLHQPNYQNNAIINYTSMDVPYTRIIEHKHFEMFGPQVESCPKTVITKEYPSEWREGMEPFYPINDKPNNQLYLKYKALADAQTNVLFGGRLAEYKYYDMAPIVEIVLNMQL